MKKSFLGFVVVPLTLMGADLGELVSLSKSNKMIDVSKQQLNASMMEYKSVQKGYLPNLTLGANYQTTNKETSAVPENMGSVYGTLSYVIYDGGKKQNIYDLYENTIESGSHNLQNRENQIALQVVNYYYTYLSLLSQKEAKQKEIEQLQAQQKRLERFYEAGTTTDDEVQKIISRVQSATVVLHELELQTQTILHNLEYTVGKEVQIDGGSKMQEYLSKEETLRADIKALEYDLLARKADAKIEKSGDYPTLTVSDKLAYNDLKYESSRYQANSTDYSQNIISLNLSWKLFDFGATNESYKAAHKRYLALKSQYEYEKNKASVDLRLALKAYDISKLKIKSAQAGLKAANSAYDSLEAKFQNGLIDNVTYLEALSEKYNAQSALQSALYDLEIKKANIIYHSGKNIEEFIQ